MKRLPVLLGLFVLVPALASAQTAPPPPVPPVRPLPAPATPVIAAPRALDLIVVDEARRAAERALDTARWEVDALRWNLMDQVGEAPRPLGAVAGQSSESSTYNSALNAMSQRKYEDAITRFDRVIAQKGPHADGAMYHKAFCQAKLGQATQAVATLGELRRAYPQSPYLKDARALEADVMKLGPSQVDDEDVKLLALQALQYQDPAQAIQLLQGVLASPTNSLKMKERAIVVLAGIDQPQAHQLLLGYAKGSGNPDLQRQAITYLGARGQKTTVAELIDIYNSTKDYDVRYAVIGAFRSAGAKAPLLSIAQTGLPTATVQPAGQYTAVVTDARELSLRSRAISNLTELASPAELWPLYQKEENKDLRVQWVSTFSAMGAVEQLLQIARTEKDPAVSQRAIRALGSAKADKTGTALVDLYGTGDKDVRTAVIAALGTQRNAEGLIAVYGKETDADLRVLAVRQLVNLAASSKVATDFLVNIIKR